MASSANNKQLEPTPSFPMAHNFDQTALAELQEKFTLLESKTNACLDTHECRLSECAEKIQELQSMVDKVKRTQSALSTALAEFEMQLASSYSKLANQTAELSNTMEGDVHHIKHTMDALEARTDLRHDRLWNMVLEQTERGLCTLCVGGIYFCIALRETLNTRIVFRRERFLLPQRT